MLLVLPTLIAGFSFGQQSKELTGAIKETQAQKMGVKSSLGLVCRTCILLCTYQMGIMFCEISDCYWSIIIMVWCIFGKTSAYWCYLYMWIKIIECLRWMHCHEGLHMFWALVNEHGAWVKRVRTFEASNGSLILSKAFWRKTSSVNHLTAWREQHENKKAPGDHQLYTLWMHAQAISWDLSPHRTKKQFFF